MESDNLSYGRFNRQPTRTVSATQAARAFSDLLSRLQYRGERFLIERNGELVGELCPVAPPRFTGADLLALLRPLSPPAASGIQIGTHDLLIASTAMAMGFGFITLDARSFPRIPGLDVVLLTA